MNSKREQIANFHATSERRVSKVAKFTEKQVAPHQAFSALLARCEQLEKFDRYGHSTVMSFDKLRSERERLWLELASRPRLLSRYDAVVAEFERSHAEGASW